MEEKQDICPHCGCTDTTVGRLGQTVIVPKNTVTFLSGEKLYLIICRKCGTVIRSYIEDPQDLG